MQDLFPKAQYSHMPAAAKIRLNLVGQKDADLGS
jgi:hypothetical protein